ncbi:hypothetical protein ACVGX7_17195 [Enterobacter hormaechei]
MKYLEDKIIDLLNKAYELEPLVIKHQMDATAWSNSPSEYPDYQEWINDGHDKYESPFFDILKSIYLSVSLYVEKTMFLNIYLFFIIYLGKTMRGASIIMNLVMMIIGLGYSIIRFY